MNTNVCIQPKNTSTEPLEHTRDLHPEDQHHTDLRTVLDQFLHCPYRPAGAVRVVSIHDGYVRLEGRVATLEERDQLLQTLRAVPGVRMVYCAVHVRPNMPESTQDRLGSGDRV